MAKMDRQWTPAELDQAARRLRGALLEVERFIQCIPEDLIDYIPGPVLTPMLDVYASHVRPALRATAGLLATDPLTDEGGSDAEV